MADQKKPRAAPGAGWTPAQRQAVTRFSGTRAARGSAANPFVPETRAQYNALPVGTYYLASNGTFSRKQTAQERALTDAGRSMGHSRNYDRGRAFTQGATMGLGDEAVAAGAAAGVWFDNVRGKDHGYTAREAYDARMDAESAARKAYDKAHPIESMAFNAAGDLATSLIPGKKIAQGAVWAVRGGKAVRGAVEVGQTAGKAKKAVEVLEVARTPAQALARRSAKEGVKEAVKGAVSGAAEADPGARGAGAVQGAQTGYLFGRLTPYAGAAAKSGADAVVRRVTGVSPMSAGARAAADGVGHALHLDDMAAGRVPQTLDGRPPFEMGGQNLREMGLAAAHPLSRGRPETLKDLAGRADTTSRAVTLLARTPGGASGLGDPFADLAVRRADAAAALDSVIQGMDRIDIDPSSVALLPRHVLDAAGEGLGGGDPRAFYAARNRLAQGQDADVFGRPRIASPEAMGRDNALRMAEDRLTRASDAYAPARARLDAIDQELAAFELGGRALTDPDLSAALLGPHVASMTPGARDQFRAGLGRALAQNAEARAAQTLPFGVDDLGRLRAVLPDDDFDAVSEFFGREAALRRTADAMTAPKTLFPGMPEYYRELFAHPGSAIPAARALGDHDAMRRLLEGRLLDEQLYGRTHDLVEKLMVDPAMNTANDRLDDFLFPDEDEIAARRRTAPR